MEESTIILPTEADSTHITFVHGKFLIFVIYAIKTHFRNFQDLKSLISDQKITNEIDLHKKFARLFQK